MLLFYLDYKNNYLSIQRMAEHHEITERICLHLVNAGKELHEGHVEMLKNSTKVFMWKDKSGGGRTNNALPLQQIISSWPDEYFTEDEEGSGLHYWAENAEEGDEWHGRTDYLICTTG